jgi:hypothetical protein
MMTDKMRELDDACWLFFWVAEMLDLCKNPYNGMGYREYSALVLRLVEYTWKERKEEEE